MKQIILFLVFSSSSVLAQSGKNSVSLIYEKDTSVWQYHGIICSLINNTDSILTCHVSDIWYNINLEVITPRLSYKFLKSGIWKDDDRMYCGNGYEKTHTLHPGESIRFCTTTDDFRSSASAIKIGVSLCPEHYTTYKDCRTIWSDEIPIH